MPPWANNVLQAWYFKSDTRENAHMQRLLKKKSSDVVMSDIDQVSYYKLGHVPVRCCPLNRTVNLPHKREMTIENLYKMGEKSWSQIRAVTWDAQDFFCPLFFCPTVYFYPRRVWSGSHFQFWAAAARCVEARDQRDPQHVIVSLCFLLLQQLLMGKYTHHCLVQRVGFFRLDV